MKKILIKVLIVVVLCAPFFLYPYMRIQKDRQQEQTAVTEMQSTEDSAEASADNRDKDKMKVTWETIVLFGIAAGAGALRYRHAKQMREAAREEYMKKTV